MAEKNNTRLYVLLSILAVLTLYLVLSRTVFAKKSTSKPKESVVEKLEKLPPPQGRNSNNSKPKPKANIVNIKIEEYEFGSSWHKDPFYYLDEDSLQILRRNELRLNSDMKLTGISLLDDNGYTIINSSIEADGETILTANILKVGDKFEGFRVIKIAFDHIVLRKNGRNIRLEIDEY